MTYQPYLIANWNSGLQDRLQPWLIPDDAQEQLFDGYVYRGVLNKRQGYNYFATGEEGGAPYCESRIISRITSEPATTSGGVLVQGDGTAGPYTFRIQNIPVRRGTTTITAGGQTATDDGLGEFVTSPAGGSGTIDYTTGDVTITFANVVAGATQIYVTYDYHPGLSVMMVANFITSTNVKRLIVADKERLNIYNSTTNRLDYLGSTLTITDITVGSPGTVTTSANHNLMTGDRIFIYGVIGMTEVNNQEFVIVKTGATTFTIDTTGFSAYVSGGTIQLIYSSSNSDFFSWVNYPNKEDEPRLLFSNNVNQIGYYAPSKSPAVGDYVNYPTNASPDFHMLATTAGTPAVTTLTCSYMVVFKDRLILLRTTENGIIYPQRLRISGTGQSCDDFRTSATGAGFIDIPDGSWIQGATFNRDDLLIFTEASTWVLQYTGDDTTPFTIKRIDESRGSQATFSAFTYLNRSSAASTRGFIISDGYKVERQDIEIPDFSFNQIDGENFSLCFAGSVDTDRDHYLIYPPPEQTESKRILITNYDEDNYNIYRLPLSCMGNYISAFDITWDELLRYPNWSSMAAVYGNWNSFSYNSGAPFSIGGGHKGEIWRLNVSEVEDNPVKIRDITIVDGDTIEVTTDWNNYGKNEYDPEMGADTIFLTAVEGMVEVNNQQYPLEEWIDYRTFRLKVPDTSSFSAYTSGGVAQRVIPFSALMKKFNPYVELDKKVRCGWIYMYVDTSGTNLTRNNVYISGATNSNPCVISTFTDHGFQTGDQLYFYEMQGMTELNDKQSFITVIDENSFSLNGVDSTSFGTYTSGGFCAIYLPCKITIDIITNDVDHPVRLDGQTNPFQGNCTNMTLEDGSKKWYKVFINQTGKFIQFRVRNAQAGAKIAIQAVMPGFQPVGRLI